MKLHLLIGVVLISLLTLIGCANRNQNCCPPTSHPDLLHEHWMSQINTDSTRWGQANPYVSTLVYKNFKDANALPPMVGPPRGPDFTRILIKANVRVEIIGDDYTNSVHISGPSLAAHQVYVDIHNGTVCIYTAKKNKIPLDGVIVRIHIRNLTSLIDYGHCDVTGQFISSTELNIVSVGYSNIWLSGRMNVNRIKQYGNGTISVVGAYTRHLTIDVPNSGNVNVCGHVAIDNIYHGGNGTVNVIGMDSHALKINAWGCGLTALYGYANVKCITAKGNSRVYLYWVTSNTANILTYDNARVGIAGKACTLNIETHGTSRFEGQRMRGEFVYVKTRNNSHANALARQRMFAAAFDRSTIYFFNRPSIVNRYTAQNGMILQAWEPPLPPFARRPLPWQGRYVLTPQSPLQYSS